MKYIKEYHNSNNIYYHGTVSKLPYQKFSKNCDGMGTVSTGGRKYGGFFFTSSKENAEFYSEYFVAKVSINNIIISKDSHPPTAMINADRDNKNYLVKDILDGAVFSDILVVPMSNLNDITILEWEFQGDEECEQFYFEQLDKMFGDQDENYFTTRDMISDTIEMIELDIDFLLSIPVFKKYYDSK
jgi:hypothetical protein